MKTQLILLILGLLISAGCYAQNKYPDGISKVKGEQFQISYTGLNKDLIVVYNLKSKYTKGGPVSDNPNAFPFRQEDIHFDVPAAKAIIQQVLKLKLEKLRQNEDFINIGFTFEPSGKLTDIGYGVKKGTLISLKDIAEIDARFRSTTRATYTGTTYKDYKVLMYSLGTTWFY